MLANAADYFTPKRFEQIQQLTHSMSTPLLVIDPVIFRNQLVELMELFPYGKIFYAVKANPQHELLCILRDLGGCFDIASRYELDRILALGVSADRISYGNTIKKKVDIAYAYSKGIRLFATDSEEDVIKLAENAPGSKIFVRVLTEGSQTADWPLSRKFGCQMDMAFDLCVMARELGLIPHGISFHVGSQQRDIGAWDSAIAKVTWLFERLNVECGIQLKMINIGGGFPANYLARTNSLETYAREITRFLTEDFGDEFPEVILEPGRSLAAHAGVLISEVILISRKDKNGLNRWVYTDIGKFGGFIETMDEAIKYPVIVQGQRGNIFDGLGNHESEGVVIAGPTCDSADILYEHHKYELPMDMVSGDRLFWFAAGAYTTTYSAVDFNGFPPLAVMCLPD